MADEEYERLVLDTLFRRRLRTQGCFVDNEAGKELRACPSEALSAIEHVLRDTVEPTISIGVAASRDALDLDQVVGSYLLIAARSDPERALDFFSKASESLVIESLVAIELFFRLMRDGTYNCGVAPPEQFHAFVQRASTSPSDAVRSAAARTLMQVTWPS